MATVYNLSPLRFKLPELNGGSITDTDVFPGINYYTEQEDLIVEGDYSSVFSKNFDVYSSTIAPKLVQYIPSLDAFFLVFYKGMYIYNPSIENDGVEYETQRSNIVFSITGGSTFVIDNSDQLFYEGSFYQDDLDDPFSLNGLNQTSANGNINVSISPELTKNRPLNYFDFDGTSQTEDISLRDYVSGNSSIQVPDLNPGDYFGLYLKFESVFKLDSNPVDYSFFNLSYSNDIVSSDTELFPSRETIPGKTLVNSFDDSYFIQSFSLKFNTNTEYLKSILSDKIDIMYDNYPPFFSDYRESDSVVT